MFYDDDVREKRVHNKIRKIKIKTRDRFGKAKKNRDAERRSMEQFEEEMEEIVLPELIFSFEEADSISEEAWEDLCDKIDEAEEEYNKIKKG